jgi:hypothetical protein
MYDRNIIDTSQFIISSSHFFIATKGWSIKQISNTTMRTYLSVKETNMKQQKVA